jgi:glutaredoxin
VIEYIIYTQAGRKCPWCEKAAALLDDKGKTYSLRPLEKERLLQVASDAGMTTVPIIYHEEELVGGYSELARILH